MQTILGSSGPIGMELAKALTSFTSEIRLVSRNPKKVNPTDELMAADLLNASEVRRAVQGSAVVYVTIGFPYELKIYRESWPKFMTYVIDACIEYNCKLVFFDNVYMYDKHYLNGMTEHTPINPPSKKGKVRQQVAKMVMDKVKDGHLTALIARCAFFYGPNIPNTSKITEMIYKPFSIGKKALLLSSDKHKLSITYTPDAGKAMAMLGNTRNAYNQIWHMPTASNPLTGKQWVEEIAKVMDVEPRYRILRKPALRVLGLFKPIMGELVEMVYQYESDYVFDSSKFEKRFKFKPTPYLDGIKEIAQQEFKKQFSGAS